MEPFVKTQVGPFLLETYHEPETPDVIWRTVTCTDCGKLLAKGKLDQATASYQGIADAVHSMEHECRVQ